MNKIIYIGMDVHSSNFTLCSFEPGYGIEADKIFGQTQIKCSLSLRRSEVIKDPLSVR